MRTCSARAGFDNIIAVVSNGWAAVRAGRELTNAAAWKKVQTVVNLLTALVTLAAALGYPLPVTSDGVYAIAGLIVAGVNTYLTVATTSKIGLPGASSGSNPPQLPLVELIGQPLGYNDASQNVGEAPASQPAGAGVDVAPQNSVIRRSGAGAKRSDPAFDELRQSVSSDDQPKRVEPVDPNTYPRFGAGFGDQN